MTEPQKQFGDGDTSFKAAGGEAGIRNLVEAFYARMGTDERFATIYNMHPPNIEQSIDKLARFLSGWLGGPRLYQEKYGSISIPSVHGELPIGQSEHDQWLTCMGESIDEQSFEPAFKDYLKRQLAVPAMAVWKRSEAIRASGKKPAPFGVSIVSGNTGGDAT